VHHNCSWDVMRHVTHVRCITLVAIFSMHTTSAVFDLRHVRTCGCQAGGKFFSRASRSGLVARLGVLKVARSNEVIWKPLNFG